MKNPLLYDADRNVDIDHLCCELTSAVYGVVLRGSSTHNWLELQLNLWNAIKAYLEGNCEVKQVEHAAVDY
jgi:hypothetical protein